MKGKEVGGVEGRMKGRKEGLRRKEDIRMNKEDYFVLSCALRHTVACGQ